MPVGSLLSSTARCLPFRTRALFTSANSVHHNLPLPSTTATNQLSTFAAFSLRKTSSPHRNAPLLNNAIRESSTSATLGAQKLRRRRIRKSRKRPGDHTMSIQEINKHIDSILAPAEKALKKLPSKKAVQDAEVVYDAISAPNPVRYSKTRPEFIQESLDLTAALREKLASLPNNPSYVNNRTLSDQAEPFEETRGEEETRRDCEAVLAVENHQESEDATDELGEISIDHFNSVMQANIIAEKPNEVKSAFTLIQTAGFQPNLDSFNMLLQAHAFVGDIESAQKTMQNLKDAGCTPDDRSYHALMNAFTKNDYVDQAYRLYGTMRAAGIQPTQDIFGTLIKGASSIGDYQRAWATWDRMRYEGWVANEENFGLMINICGRNKEAERALSLFQEMIDQGLRPTERAFNQAIRACSTREDFTADAFQLVAQMLRSGYSVNQDTLTSLFRACGNMDDLERARGLFFEGMISRGYDDTAMRPTAQAMRYLFYAYGKYRLLAHPTITASPPPNVAADNEQFTALVAVDEDLIHPECVRSFCFLNDGTPQSSAGIVAEATELLRLVTGVRPLPSLVPTTGVSMTGDGISKRYQVGPTSALLDSYLTVLLSHSTISVDAPYPTAALELLREYESSYGVKPNGYTYQILVQELTKPKKRIQAPGFMLLSPPEKKHIQTLRVEKAIELFEEWKQWREEREAAEMTQPEKEIEQRSEPKIEAEGAKQLVKSKMEQAALAKREGRDEIQIFRMYRALVNSIARITDNVTRAVDYLAEYRGQHNPAPKIADYQGVYDACIRLGDDDTLLRLLDICPADVVSPLEKAKSNLSGKWYGKAGKKFMITDAKRAALVERIAAEQEEKRWIESRRREILSQSHALDLV